MNRVRLLRIGRRVVSLGLLTLIACGTVGQVVRDRSAAWAVLMYLPLPLLGLVAVGFDLVCRGRGASDDRFRFGLTLVGLASLVGGSIPMVGRGNRTAPSDPTANAVRVLHWNVIWGGGRQRNSERWASIRQTIAAQVADILVLSEAPPDDWLDSLVSDLGPTGTRVQVENEPGAGYWYKLAVCSRRPLHFLYRTTLRGGVALAVEARTEGGGVVRLLVVDGQSHPFLWRTPFLHDVAGLCQRADKVGRPFDLVVGDFNSVARSLGFDALAEAGYALASWESLNWRGTFPSFAPAYDIDHIWIRRDHLGGLDHQMFTSLASDHRGQAVWFRPIRLEPDSPTRSDPGPALAVQDESTDRRHAEEQETGRLGDGEAAELTIADQDLPGVEEVAGFATVDEIDDSAATVATVRIIKSVVESTSTSQSADRRDRSRQVDRVAVNQDPAARAATTATDEEPARLRPIPRWRRSFRRSRQAPPLPVRSRPRQVPARRWFR